MWLYRHLPIGWNKMNLCHSWVFSFRADCVAILESLPTIGQKCGQIWTWREVEGWVNDLSPIWASKNTHFFVLLIYPHGDCLITPTLKNPHQNQCKQTETFTFKTLELNYHLPDDVWGSHLFISNYLRIARKICFQYSCTPAGRQFSGTWHRGSLMPEALVFQENWLNVSLCWLLLAQLLLALVVLQFLFSF